MMHLWRRRVIAGALAISCFPGTAWAVSEVDILLNKLVERGIVSSDDAGIIRREIAEAKEARTTELAKEIVPEPDRRWTWKGDVRLRDEYRNREGEGEASDAHRQRIRFRYGFEGPVTDQLKVEARIATGTSSTGGTGGDPVSTNQSFDTNLVKKNINLDLANVRYTPAISGVDSVALVGGIHQNPMWTVGPLVWDGDLSFDGAAVQVKHMVREGVDLFSSGGFALLDTGESETPMFWYTQGGAELQPMPNAEGEFFKRLKLKGAVAYHDYKNVIRSKSSVDVIAREAQNSAAANDFNQINPSIELSSTVAAVPVALFWNWARNTSAPSEQNDGFQFGLKAGRAKPALTFDNIPGWLRDGIEGGYYFQQLERDAVFDEFADSDFNDGGTNNRGHVFYVTLATLKHSTLGAKYAVTRQLDEAVAGKDHEDRIQVDWVTTF